jgi:Flp pilus assembly protein TadG
MFVLGKHDPISRVDGQWQRRLINVNAMAEAGFWVARGVATPAREKQSLNLLNETRGHLERRAQDRRIERFDIVIRTSDTPQGTWSAATTILNQQNGGIYAPMMHP